jgi:flagellar biosynthesis/type III secretory pathway protein FliH
VKAILAEDTLDWTRQWKQQGREEGRQEGLDQGFKQGLAAERALLLRQAGKRFGAACAQTLAPLLEPIDDQERLAEVGEWIVTCDTAEVFLARLQQSP